METNFKRLRAEAGLKFGFLAGKVFPKLFKQRKAEMQAIRAGALNEAVKAVAIARGYVAPNGINLVFTPAFVDIQIEGKERTALKLTVGPR